MPPTPARWRSSSRSPTIPPWELFDAIPTNIPIIVSDDSDGKLAPPPRDNVWYFDYAAQREYCGEHFAAMPHKSAASRNVGPLHRLQGGLRRHHRPRLRLRHPARLARRPTSRRSTRWSRPPPCDPVVDDGWVNSIDAEGVYARGYPYELRTPELSAVEATTATGEVKINMGIWDGILDLNGIDKLQAGEPGDPAVGVRRQPHRPRQHPGLRHEHRVRGRAHPRLLLPAGPLGQRVAAQPSRRHLGRLPREEAHGPPG